MDDTPRLAPHPNPLPWGEGSCAGAQRKQAAGEGANLSSPIPSLGFGLGLRTPHVQQILRERPRVDWFEIISDNYINAHDGHYAMLEDIRADYPLVMHGVSLSIGSTDALNLEYIAALAALAKRVDAAWVSDHLCYTGVQGAFTHDLLPIPFTPEALAHIVPRIHKVQDIVQRAFVFENASTYLEFDGQTMCEPEFLNQLCVQTGCKLLLDINNVVVSSFNHGWDVKTYLDAIPSDAVVQYHLAGHSDYGTHRIDTHDQHVSEEVWRWFAYTIATKGMRSTMVEWDENIPEFKVLHHELQRARESVI